MAVMGRRMAIALNALLTVAVVVVAVGLGIGVAEERAARLDCTDRASQSLGAGTLGALAVAEDAEVAVEITAFSASSGSDDGWLRDRTVGDFLRALTNASPAVRVRQVDFDRERAVALAYDVDAYGTVVIEGAGRRVDLDERDVFWARGTGPDRILSFVGERAIGAAIRRVVRGDRARVGVLTGRGVRSMVRHRRFALVLEDEGIELERVSLLEDLPGGLEAVLVLAPKEALATEQLERLDMLLEAGGGVGWFAEPGGPSLGRLGARGVSLAPGVVGSVVSYAQHDDRPLLQWGRHPVTDAGRDAGLAVVVAGAAPVVGGRWLLRTGSEGWVAEGGERRSSGETAVAAVTEIPEGGRLLVAGDVDVLGDELLGRIPGNESFAVNAVRWLVGADAALAGVGRPARLRPLAMGPAQRRTVRGGLVAWGVLVALAGVVVARLRRRGA